MIEHTILGHLILFFDERLRLDNEMAALVRDSNSGHQLRLPSSNWCPIFCVLDHAVYPWVELYAICSSDAMARQCCFHLPQALAFSSFHSRQAPASA